MELGASGFIAYIYHIDSDNDGLSNGIERRLGLDPCNAYTSPHQLASCIKDGNIDSDGDGIVNTDDDQPTCNGICV